MSSGSPSQTVHEVGGPVRGRPEQPPDRDAEELALQVVQRAVERRPRRVLARRQPRLDLLERERVVAEQRARAPRRRRARSAPSPRSGRSPRPRRSRRRRRAAARPGAPPPRRATRARSRTSRRARQSVTILRSASTALARSTPRDRTSTRQAGCLRRDESVAACSAVMRRRRRTGICDSAAAGVRCEKPCASAERPMNSDRVDDAGHSPGGFEPPTSRSGGERSIP